MSSILKKHKHHISVLIIFALISYPYGAISSLLSLHLVNHFNIHQIKAVDMTSTFIALAFFLPILTGLIGSKLGAHRMVLAALIISMVSVIALSGGGQQIFFLGVAGAAVSVATFMPNILVIIGNMYKKSAPSRKNGFILSYMLMNIGLALGSFLTGALVTSIGFSHAMFMSIVPVVFAVIIFALNRDFISIVLYATKSKIMNSKFFIILMLTIVLVACSYFLLINDRFDLYFFSILFGGILFCSLCLVILKRRMRASIITFYILLVISCMFWILFSLEPSLIILYVKKYVDLCIMGYKIDASMIYGLESFFVILFAIPCIKLFNLMRNRALEPKDYQKFNLAIVIMGVGFMVLAFSVNVHPHTKVSSTWILLSYVFFAIAELMIAPIGQSIIGQLFDKNYEGIFQGVWQGITGCAIISAPLLSKFAFFNMPGKLIWDRMTYEIGFLRISFFSIIIGLSLLCATMVSSRLISIKHNLTGSRT